MWISINDRLPDKSYRYLVFRKGGYDLVYYDADFKEFYKGQGITHWMPLPEPPKMEGG
jgi:hypothetical protein